MGTTFFSVDEIVNGIDELVKMIKACRNEYNNEMKRTLAQLNQGIITSKGVEQQRNYLQKQLLPKIDTKQTTLEKKVNEMRQRSAEYKGDELTYEEIAELNFLSDLELTKDELLAYFIKYDNKPIGLKKLETIAKKLNIFVTYQSKVKIFNELVETITDFFDYVKKMKLDEDDLGYITNNANIEHFTKTIRELVALL